MFFIKTSVVILLCGSFHTKAQIANYVNNGGFEKTILDSYPPVPKNWGPVDGTSVFGVLLSANLLPYNVPLSSYSYQWPRHGNNYLGITLYCSTCPHSTRGYPRNILKANLQAGKTYCFSMFVNLTNKSSYAISSIGAYFIDSAVDTINYCTIPLTYLTPQIQNPSGNFLTDTLNWVPIKGLYTANGTEKYLMIGNFNNDSGTDTFFVNPQTLPQKGSAYFFDDISLIDINLHAFAGRDTVIFPGDSVFLGREPDVGIDEACIWYKLPDLVNPIDTIAGFWVNPTSTATYIVKQQLWCNNTPKWDTVVVETSIYVGLNKVRLSVVEGDLEVFPNPANDYLEIKIQNQELIKSTFNIIIKNNLGQTIREEELIFKENKVEIKINDLQEGVYFLQIKSNNLGTARKRFIISR